MYFVIVSFNGCYFHQTSLHWILLSAIRVASIKNFTKIQCKLKHVLYSKDICNAKYVLQFQEKKKETPIWKFDVLWNSFIHVELLYNISQQRDVNKQPI